MERFYLYIVLTRTNTVMSKLIQIFKNDEYTHAAISLDKGLNQMYSFGRKKTYNPFIGRFKKEDINEGIYKFYDTLPGAIIETEVSRRQYEKAKGGGRTVIYVALLRGINVGGKNKIEMKKLKETFESVGMKSVITYINSGNVIFEDLKHTKAEIISILEEVIYEDFTLNIKVLTLSINDFSVIIDTIPNYWKNDKDMKSDVLFLWEEVNYETVLNELVIKPTIDNVLYVQGAILWSVDKKNLTKSGLMKLASMKLYKKMTIRNVNSTRKIYTIMQEILSSKYENL